MNLTPLQSDALSELVNIGVGRAAGAINDLSGAHVTLQVPHVQVVSWQAAREKVSFVEWDLLATVQLKMTGTLSGHCALVFPLDSAARFVTLLTGEDASGADLGGLRSATLSEVGNILLNGVVGAISNLFNASLGLSLPYYSEDMPRQFLDGARPERESGVVLASTRFAVSEHQIEGEILLFLELASMELLMAALEAAGNPATEHA